MKKHQQSFEDLINDSYWTGFIKGLSGGAAFIALIGIAWYAFEHI